MEKDANKGRILSVQHAMDGYTHVVLDNGATNVMRLVLPSENFPHFALQDEREIHELLANPVPGARNKPKHQGKRG